MIWELVSLPLKGHEIFYLVSGLAFTVGLLALPVARGLVRLRFTANQVTVVRTVVFWIGMCLYKKGHYFWAGHTIALVGWLGDKTDGQMARIEQAIAKRAGRIVSSIGKWLDPLADKVTLPPALIWMAWLPTMTLSALLTGEGWTHQLVVSIAIALVDGIGTITRTRRFRARFRLCMRHTPWLKSRRRARVAANIVGKSKVVGQYFFLLALEASFQGSPPPLWLSLFLGLATLTLGVWSVVSKLGFGPNADTYVARASAWMKALVRSRPR